jgi:hypothetical protein
MIRATIVVTTVLAMSSLSGQLWAKPIGSSPPDGALVATSLLGHYIETIDFGDSWKRPRLSPPDRSLVTVAIIVAQGRTNEMPYHFDMALSNGVPPPRTIWRDHAGRLLCGPGLRHRGERYLPEHGVKPEDLAVSDQLRAIDKEDEEPAR